MLISTAWAQSGGADGGGALVGFLPLILIFVIFYFLLIRPQQKRQKQHQQKLQAIRRGDKILTGGGVFGTVSKVIDETELQVEIADGVKVRVSRAMVADVINKTEPAKGGAAAANDATEKKGGLLGGLLGGQKAAASPAPADKDGDNKGDAEQDDTKKGDEK
ncbi:preprotein translocase subunit YajC [Marivibrio halodurans]|uniref:Sec translocon accessory complex subunit YajC n=1 Tax=Marivibrio halodurans TaxID=2039722 RepID=A0A8J7V2R9_9PROT|nr:preprotein translocase subunit YajC [Marivibrio halodurans]